MPPPQEFYTKPKEQDKVIAQRWQKVEYVTGQTPNGQVTESLFPCKITTAKGQELFATMRLSDYRIEGGVIEIPFGIWNKSGMDPVDGLKIVKAKEMQNIALIGTSNVSDFKRYEILGIDKDRTKNFHISPSRGHIETIDFSRESDGSLRGLVLKDAWPSRSLRVEGLVRDFQEDFPGWEIEPISLQNN